VNAIERFDVDRGVEFSSFAVPTILGEIRRCFRDQSWAVRVPRDLQETALKVEATIEELTESGTTPTIADIAAATGFDDEAIMEAREALGGLRALSLDAPRSGEEPEGADLMALVGDEDPGFSQVEDAMTAGSLVRQLDKRAQTILRLRFEDGLTQTEIGAQVGLSQMQISRLLRQALADLGALAQREEPDQETGGEAAA
jgi:RNA polymerase sigma-B factor